MSAGQGQHQQMPTTSRVGTVSPAQNGDYGSSNAAEGQPGAGMTSSQQIPCYSDGLDFIRETHDKLIVLTMELKFKASAVPALSKKSARLEEKRDSSSTGMPAGASSPKKHRFFSPSSSFYDF